MNDKNRRCLVIGGTGFVGVKLCDSLLSMGCVLSLLSRNRTNLIVATQHVCDFAKDDIPPVSLKEIDAFLSGLCQPERI